MSGDWGSVNFSSILRDWQNSKEYRDLNWVGSFPDYINLVKKNPKITRNAFQRLYDLIVEKGSEEYVDVKKHVVHYKFFDVSFDLADYFG